MTTTTAWDSVPEFTMGDYLRKAREYAGLEQTELAHDIGISRQTVTNYEKGYVHPRKATVMAWGDAVRGATVVDSLQGRREPPHGRTGRGQCAPSGTRTPNPLV